MPERSFGSTPQTSRKNTGHDGVAAGKGDADPQDALLIFSQVGKFVLHCPVFFLEVCGVLAKDLSGVGEFQGNMADEELAVQLLFQICNMGAQGLLGDMNFLSMDYFLMTAEKRSFTKAADALHITQQTLSTHIANLEQELDCKLFVRHVPLELTYAGEIFWQYAADFQKKYRA